MVGVGEVYFIFLFDIVVMFCLVLEGYLRCILLKEVNL